MELDEAALARRSQDAVEAVEHGIVAMAGKLRRRVSTARRSEWIRPPYLFRVFKPGLGVGPRSGDLGAIAALAGRTAFRPPQTLQLTARRGARGGSSRFASTSPPSPRALTSTHR